MAAAAAILHFYYLRINPTCPGVRQSQGTPVPGSASLGFAMFCLCINFANFISEDFSARGVTPPAKIHATQQKGVAYKITQTPPLLSIPVGINK